MRAKFFALTLLALVSGVQCVAQTYYGGLRGTVMDPTGQAIAGGTRPVNTAYLQQAVQGASVTVEALRRDRLLAEAAITGGDPLALAHLFGLSHGTAIQYCSQAGLLGEPDEA